MLLGFKRRFAPFVENGSKTHTIRGERKRPVRVGEMCHCYVDPRQKTMRLLGRWPCTKVERITITGPQEYHWSEIEVFVDGMKLDADEKEVLAFRDGFRDFRYARHFAEMMEFWSGRLPFSGYIIHWDYKHPVEVANRKRDKNMKTLRTQSRFWQSPQRQTRSWKTPHGQGNTDATGKMDSQSDQHSDDLWKQAQTFQSSPLGPETPDGPKCWCGSPGCALPSHKRKLNAIFETWLMGWPLWWVTTVPQPFARSETALWLLRQRAHLWCLLGGSQ